MDYYKLEEVKNIIDKNLLSPEVLKTILKSSTRRVETYGDDEAISILKYLSNHESIPDETKEEINKYLAQYENYNIENIEKEKSTNKNFITILLITIIALIIITIITVLRGK